LFFEDSSFLDKLLGVSIILLSIMLILLVVYLGYYSIDKASSKVYQDNGIVYYGKFVPRHTTTTIVSTGKVMVPVLINHDDAWYLDVQVTDGRARASVSKDFYDSININDSVMVQYTRGVFTKSNIYIKYIEKLKR
jgi:hypothetical protein